MSAERGAAWHQSAVETASHWWDFIALVSSEGDKAEAGEQEERNRRLARNSTQRNATRLLHVCGCSQMQMQMETRTI